MKKILVPCDFSDPAKQAYRFAINLASKTGGEIFVLKTIDFPFTYETSFASGGFYVDLGLLKELEEDSNRNFEAMRAANPSQGKVTFTVTQGGVTPVIRNFIDQYKIDLVVMGTHGSSGLSEYFVGSNTEKIVRLSPVPVIAVREAANLSTIESIVFPTDLQLNQSEFVAKVKDLQAFFGATLHVVVINTPYNMTRTKDESNLMEEFAKHYNLSNYTLNTRNDFYEPDGIINFVNEIKADMIAMATHSRRGLAHLFIGSIAEDVVNHVTCPIWTCTLKKSN